MDMGGMAMAAAPGAPGAPFPHPQHGGWLGHMLPGGFFLFWGSWWLLGVFRLALRATPRAPYAGRAWFDLPWAPRRVPLEPLFKVVLPFIGINGELWFGHESWRNLYGDDGRFVVGNINEWQHSAMYVAFLLSGVVDLVGFYMPPGTLPVGTEQAVLSLAFVVEGTLFAFHLEGAALNVHAHLLLVLCIFAAAGALALEMRFPSSALLGALRAQLVVLQGIWFTQIARLLFEEHPQWHPGYHGSVMMVPVVFVACLMSVVAATFALFVGARLWQLRAAARAPSYKALRPDEEEAWAASGQRKEVEVAVLAGQDAPRGRIPAAHPE